MRADDVRSAISAVTGQAFRGTEGRCPAHEDHVASLSVTDGEAGVVLHCHAGCEPEAVLAAAGLGLADLYDEPPTSATVVATYTYTDALGTPLFVKRRYSPKGFSIHKPDGTPGMGDATRVLYRLPEVLAAASTHSPLWVVEGEKDADRLVAEGVVATTNPGGAGPNKWLPQHTKALAGAEVVNVVADDDPAGRAHAERIRTELEAAGIPAKLWLPLAGKDVSDHLAAGHGLADLRRYDDEAPKLAAWAINWHKLLSEDDEDTQWLCEPVIPVGTVSLYAPAKAGKSLLMLPCAVAVASGRAFLAQQAGLPRHVCYVDYEMTRRDLRDRMADLGYADDPDLIALLERYLHYVHLPVIRGLDTAEGAAEVLAAVDHWHAELVIFDTTARALEGKENEADTIRAFYRHTGGPLKTRGVSWFRIDHAGHDADHARGTSAKADDVDLVWRQTRVDGGIKLEATHARMSWVPREVLISFGEDDAGVWHHTLSGAELWPAGTKETAAILDALGVPLSATVMAAKKAMKDGERRVRGNVIAKAVKWRRTRADSIANMLVSHTDTDPDTARHADTRVSGHVRVSIGTRRTVSPAADPFRNGSERASSEEGFRLFPDWTEERLEGFNAEEPPAG